MSAPPIRLLLLEDNPGDALLLQAALAAHAPGEFAITTVERLADALARIGAEPFDLILCDLGLPDSAGFATAQAIVAHAPQQPVVVLTGSDDASVGRMAIQFGAQDYLVKGEASGSSIARTLHYAVERKNLQNQLDLANKWLEQRVAARTAELETAVAQLTENERELRAAQVETHKMLALSEQSRLALLSVAEDQLQASAALRENEFRLRRLFESDLIGILYADMDRIWEANDAFLRIVGYTPADLQAGAIKWAAMTPPEWAAADANGLEELKARGSCTPFEKEYFRKDGSRVAILIGAALLEKEPLKWVCFVQNISERKRAEAEINVQLDELRRWQVLMLDRADLRMELKREVNALCRRLGEPIRYRSQEESGSEES